MVLPTTTTAAVVPPTPPPVATPRPLANDHAIKGAIKGAFMLIILPYDTHALLDSCSDGFHFCAEVVGSTSEENFVILHIT